MAATNQSEYLYLADVNGVGNLTLYCNAVHIGLYNVHKKFLMWLKKIFSNPIDCNHFIFICLSSVPSFTGESFYQNRFNRFLCFWLERIKVIYGG